MLDGGESSSVALALQSTEIASDEGSLAKLQQGAEIASDEGSLAKLQQSTEIASDEGSLAKLHQSTEIASDECEPGTVGTARARRFFCARRLKTRRCLRSAAGAKCGACWRIARGAGERQDRV